MVQRDGSEVVLGTCDIGEVGRFDDSWFTSGCSEGNAAAAGFWRHRAGETRWWVVPRVERWRRTRTDVVCDEGFFFSRMA